MKNSLVYLRPTPMACIRVIGPYETSIPAAWEKMFAWLERHRLSSPVGRGYGLAYDNSVATAPEKRRYDACIQLTPMLEERALRELSAATLPGGPYMRQRLSGPYETISAMVGRGIDPANMADDIRLDERRPMVTIYLDDPRHATTRDLRADLCLPIAAASSRVRAA